MACIKNEDMRTERKKWIAVAVLTAIAVFGAGFATGWVCHTTKRRKPVAKPQEKVILPERDQSGNRIYYTGERGGKYYIRDGKKVYVRKRKKRDEEK